MQWTIYYLVVLRLLHITSSVFWAGSAIYLALFVLPAVKTTGPEGGKFMQQLAKTNSLPNVMNAVSLISVFTGGLLLWKLSGGFSSSWFGTLHGVILLSGGSMALIGYLIGQMVNRPTVGKMAVLNNDIITQGMPPTPQQMENLGKLRLKLTNASNYMAWFLGASIILMSLAKYY